MLTPMLVAGIGTATPEGSLSQIEAAGLAVSLGTALDQPEGVVRALHRRTGVLRRHSVLVPPSGGQQDFYGAAAGPDDRGPGTRQRMARFALEAPGLAARAASEALAAAAVSPDRVTHLVCVSCTGFEAPGFDVELVRRLGLRATVARTQVGFMGCHGMLNALRVAQAACAADADAVVLACAVELCTLHQQVSADAGQIVANALFADGAAAAACRAESEGALGGAGWRLAASGSAIVPGTEELMSWRIGDHGFEMRLDPAVPDVIRAELRPMLCSWLDSLGLGLRDVATWAVHPGGPRILDAVASALELGPGPLAPSRGVLARFGNMSSPTILFIVQDLMASGAGLPCVALGFGPGLTIEAALFR